MCPQEDMFASPKFLVAVYVQLCTMYLHLYSYVFDYHIFPVDMAYEPANHCTVSTNYMNNTETNTTNMPGYWTIRTTYDYGNYVYII